MAKSSSRCTWMFGVGKHHWHYGITALTRGSFAVRILRLCCSALKCIPLTIAAANGGRADEAVVCAEKVILVAVNAQETDGAEARVFANKLLSTHLGSHENYVLCFRNKTEVVRS